MRRVLLALFTLLVVAREARADEPSDTQQGATPVPEEGAPPAGEAAEAAAAAKPAESQEVFLHVSSKKPVTIERDDTGEVVCTSPCDKPVPADVKYRIGGHRPSGAFVLQPPANGRADLHVKPGSKAGFWTGVAGLAVGTLLIGGGIGTLIYGVENRPPVPGGDGETTDNTFTDTMSLGTALIVGGVFVGLGGAAFLASNASTSVWGHVQKTAGPGARDALPRAQPNTRAVALPRPTYLSIFSGTF